MVQVMRKIPVKAADGIHATVNGLTGLIYHFDSSPAADPRAQEMEIPASDYFHLRKQGVIAANEDYEAEQVAASGDMPFVPAGSVVFETQDDFAAAVDAILERRLAAMAAAEDSVGATTGLSHKALTAYPDNQPVGNFVDDGDIADEEEAPAGGAKRGRGRPAKAKAEPDPAAVESDPAEDADKS